MDCLLLLFLFFRFFFLVVFFILLYFTCHVRSCQSTSVDSCGSLRQNLLN